MAFDLNISKVVTDMLQAALPFRSKGGQKASSYAANEFQQYIVNLRHIQEMTEAKDPKIKITPEEAQFLSDQYKMSMQAVLLAIEGLGVIAVQQAINAAVDVLNKALETVVSGGIKSLKFSI